MVSAASAAAPKQRPGLRRRCAFAPAALGLVGLLQLHGAFLPAAPSWAAQPRAAPRSGRTARAAVDVVELEGTVDPLGSHVLVKLAEAEEYSTGGILLPSKGEKPKAGEVVSVGPGEKNSETGYLKEVEVSPGAKVVYNKYGGSTKLKLSGVEHALVRQDEILYSYSGDEATLQSLTMPRGMLLVRLEEAKTETSFGLLLSKDAAKPSTTVGEVVAVGAGEMLANGDILGVPLEVGDMVRFRYGDEVELDIGDDRFSAVRMSSCIAKWKA